MSAKNYELRNVQVTRYGRLCGKHQVIWPLSLLQYTTGMPTSNTERVVILTLQLKNTQGEMRHKLKKAQYQRTNKNTFEKQIAGREGIREKIQMIDDNVARVLDLKSATQMRKEHASKNVVGESVMCFTHGRTTISKGRNYRVNLSEFIETYQEDPAIEVRC